MRSALAAKTAAIFPASFLCPHRAAFSAAEAQRLSRRGYAVEAAVAGETGAAPEEGGTSFRPDSVGASLGSVACSRTRGEWASFFRGPFSPTANRSRSWRLSGGRRAIRRSCRLPAITRNTASSATTLAMPAAIHPIRFMIGAPPTTKVSGRTLGRARRFFRFLPGCVQGRTAKYLMRMAKPEAADQLGCCPPDLAVSGRVSWPRRSTGHAHEVVTAFEAPVLRVGALGGGVLP